MMLEVAVETDGEWDSRIGWSRLAETAARAAIAESRFPDLAGAERLVEISVLLTTDEEVRRLNSQWRGKDSATNVLSFPLAELADLEGVSRPGPEILLGDIVLARETCAQEAAAKGVGVDRHAAHLLVHGTLHLLGYDHEGEDEADDMESREVRALARLGIADPYAEAA